MSFYFYFFLFILSVIVALSIRIYILRKENLSWELFEQALRDENSGDFEAAVIAYESALDEVNKGRFNNGLKNKINEKLKLLQAIIKYEKGLHFIR